MFVAFQENSTLWFHNTEGFHAQDIPYDGEGGKKVTGEFSKESVKAVYSIGATSNELNFVYDKTYYSSRIFNVPEYSGFNVGQSTQWYEQSGEQQAQPAAEAAARCDFNVDSSSAFELLASGISNDFGDGGFASVNKYNLPEWFNYYPNDAKRGIECVLDGNVNVIFSQNFINFNNLYSMSC